VTRERQVTTNLAYWRNLNLTLFMLKAKSGILNWSWNRMEEAEKVGGLTENCFSKQELVRPDSCRRLGCDPRQVKQTHLWTSVECWKTTWSEPPPLIWLLTMPEPGMHSWRTWGEQFLSSPTGLKEKLSWDGHGEPVRDAQLAHARVKTQDDKHPPCTQSFWPSFGALVKDEQVHKKSWIREGRDQNK
jgi:hypothetical protein